MTMSPTESLARIGYVGWPDAVDQDRVRRARRAIHRDLGRNGLDPKRLPEFENASYCPTLRRHPDILSLFKGTRLQAEAERLLGPLEPVDYAQIALRFPHEEGTPANPPHLDGVSAPHNGVAPGEIKTFSALAVVYLSDVVADGGAFTVWPGSHLAHAEYFRRNGPESLLDGMPNVRRTPPVALVGGPGHGFLVHYLVGHAFGVHVAPDVRYAVFFRLRAIGHRARGRGTMTDPWLEWRLPGLKPE